MVRYSRVIWLLAATGTDLLEDAAATTGALTGLLWCCQDFSPMRNSNNPR